MERRALLRRAAAVGVAALAGCGSTRSDPADGDGTTQTPTDGGTPTRTPDQPRAVADATVETVETDCESGDEPGASVAFPGGERVTFDGRVTAPNPCHRMTLASATYDAEADRLVVALDTSSGDKTCTMCTGVVRFAGSVTLQGGLPAAVRITHGQTVLADVDRHGSEVVASSVFAVRDRTAGGNAPRAAVAFQDGPDRLLVDGTIRGDDGCQTAHLRRVDYDREADVATVAVRTTTDPDADANCTQGAAGVVYEAAVTFDDGLPDRARVVHDGTAVVTAGH